MKIFVCKAVSHRSLRVSQTDCRLVFSADFSEPSSFALSNRLFFFSAGSDDLGESLTRAIFTQAGKTNSIQNVLPALPRIFQKHAKSSDSPVCSKRQGAPHYSPSRVVAPTSPRSGMSEIRPRADTEKVDYFSKPQ
jgi:hypothetical protein